jgi:hypothetical protein
MPHTCLLRFSAQQGLKAGSSLNLNLEDGNVAVFGTAVEIFSNGRGARAPTFASDPS